MADAEERKFLKAENAKVFKRESEAQHGNDDIFNYRAIIDAVKSWEFAKGSIFYSYGNFWDFFTIALCLICGIYTTGIFC